ncbi:hypothetical protein [Mesorhizobium sp.]|uniref:hypothetical protein n=1 Tax=Mesorhizobium sp. TaxID=1871066 RepID=UPI0025BBE7F1|nr:hypothetical protein [Mesorhizobium sp.]
MQKEGKSTAYAMPTDEKREERREENEDAIAPYKRAEAEAVRREFDAWWALYPNKVDKAAGWKAFPVALKKIGPQGLMDGLRQYIETKPTDRQWLNPATWLNGERWGDRPANVSARQARKTASSVLADLVRSQDGGEFMKHMHELPTDTLTIEGDCYRPVIA